MGFKKTPFKRAFTDEEGHPIDKHGNRIDVDELDVPMWKSYGVHKRYRPWLTKLNDILVKILAIVFLSPIFFAAGLVTFIILYLAPVFPGIMFATVMLVLSGLIFLYINGLRVPRKRAAFYIKVKRFCRKNRYTVRFERNFWSSLFWAKDERLDFVIKAGNWTYYVKVFGSTHKRSDVTFCHDGELMYRRYPKKNLISHMFDLQPRVRKIKIVFPETPEGEKNIKAVVLNPVPMEMYKKKQNREVEMTGNCDALFGYTVFTDSGFLDSVRLNIDKEKWDVQNGRI